MTEDQNISKPEGNIEGSINAVTGLVQAVPIYQDAIQPAAQEIGKALGTLAKTVNIALAPVSALVWGYDQIRSFVDIKVSEKLQNVPDENIITPPPNIAGPALESLRYTGSIEELKELYANLLASSMDANSTTGVHPCFVEIIKQLSADEAKLLSAFITSAQEPIINIRNMRKDNSGGRDHYRFFTNLGEIHGITKLDQVPSYLDNLCRLGLIEIPDSYQLLGEDAYKHLEEHPTVIAINASIDAEEGRKHQIVKTAIKVTGLGRQFITTCVLDHRKVV